MRRVQEAPLLWWAPAPKARWRSLFLIDPAAAAPARRGFRTGDPAQAARLERIGRTFLQGYAAGLLGDSVATAAAQAAQAPAALRGFAFEGATLGVAVADVTAFRRPQLPAWMAAVGPAFGYLAHVGAGWALARLPFRRRAILQTLDPIHRWLAHDGWGFHDAYWRPRQVLQGWRRIRRGYASAAYDQGVGRALWFVGGGDLEFAARWIAGVEASRRPYLWSGLGLALAYAGEAPAHELARLPVRAGPYLADLKQGAAFAAAAHARGGATPPHCAAACAVLLGMKPQAAEQQVDRARAEVAGLGRPQSPEAPLYEQWRLKVALALSTAGAG